MNLIGPDPSYLNFLYSLAIELNITMGSLSNPPGRRRATILVVVGGYINTGITVVQGLLLVPLYIIYIGAYNYGLWLATAGVVGMLSAINLGINGLLTQRVSNAYGQNNFEKAGAYFVNGAIINFAISIIFGATGWLLSLWLPQILNISGQETEVLLWGFFIAVAAMSFTIFNECLRSFSLSLLRPVLPMVAMGIGRIAGIVSSIWLLFNDFGLLAIPLGLFVAEGLILILNLANSFYLIQLLRARIRYNKSIIVDYLRNSPPLFMARFGTTLSQESEPLLVTFFLGPEITAAYMITRRAADMAMQMLSVVAGSILGPFAHLASGTDHKKTARIAVNLLFLSFSLSTIGYGIYVGANYIFVTVWVGENLALSQIVILAIGVAFLGRNIRAMIVQILYGLNDFTYSSVIIVLEGVVRLIISVILISSLGVIGLPIALAISSFVATGILVLRMKRKLQLNLNYFRMMKLAISVVVVFAISLYATSLDISSNSWPGLIGYAIVLSAFIGAGFIAVNMKKIQEIYQNLRN